VLITFFGTRGSCPCAGDAYQGFGGNTSCVYIENSDGLPVILDAGTGLRALGAWLRPQLQASGHPLHARLLLSHLHYDHMLGLPFFSPLEDPGALVEVFGPEQASQPLSEVIDSAVTPPFFPINMKEFRGELRLIDVGEGMLDFGELKVVTRWVPHTGPTLGFRLESKGSSVAYIPDHQAPVDRSDVDDSVIELCNQADVVIHDAQYDDEEFALKSHWGHSTVAYAVNVAVRANAKTLVLFHHDPSHDDDRLSELERTAQALAAASGNLRVIGAREGMILDTDTDTDTSTES
jgi:ribonuclease BN (tRNA processing enzyme)